MFLKCLFCIDVYMQPQKPAKLCQLFYLAIWKYWSVGHVWGNSLMSFFFFLLYSYLGLYLDKSCPYFSVLYSDHYWLDSTRLEIHYSKILFLFVSSNVFDQNLDQGLNLLFLPKYSLFCSAKTVDYVLKRFIEICSFKNKLSSLIKNKQTNSSKEKIH